MEFMNMGLVFVADAGPNRFAIHQAANDGFRGVYVVFRWSARSEVRTVSCF